MHVPEGTIMGIGQDWVEEEQEMEEYSETVGAIVGVGEGIQEHMKDICLTKQGWVWGRMRQWH